MNKARFSANVTILFVLILTPLFTLLSALNESARIAMQRTLVKGALYTGTMSVFSEYVREIYDEYGIFVINETSRPLSDRYRSYIEYNLKPGKDLVFPSNISGMYTPSSFNLNITGVKYITDENGRFFFGQVIEYTKRHLFNSNIGKLKRIFDTASDTLGDGIYIPPIGTEADADTAGDIAGKIKGDAFPDLSDGEEPPPGDETQYDDSTRSAAKEKKKNIVDFLKGLTEDALLSIIVSDTSKISALRTDLTRAPSKVIKYDDAKNSGDYSFSFKNIAKDSANRCLYIAYLLEKFPSYRNALKNPCNMPLEYQLEYIIGGTGDDKTNLLRTGTELISLRTCLNMISIFMQSDKLLQALALAQILSFGIPVPFITTAIQYTLLSLWAYAEAISDARSLLDGRKVPFIKTGAEWNLSLESITDLNSYGTSEGRSGFDYSDYMSILLFCKNTAEMSFRTMDLIQLNIAHKYKSDFTMTKCIFGIRAELSCVCKPIFLIPGKKKYFLREVSEFSY